MQRVVPGALMSSNVNVVNEMVNMIELSRRFELQVKMMKTAEESAAAASSIITAGLNLARVLQRVIAVGPS